VRRGCRIPAVLFRFSLAHPADAELAPRPRPISGTPPSKSTKISETRSRCAIAVSWLVPIAAATAKESRPSGRTNASSFSTASASHEP
jgi:hypothetical protein